MRSYLVTAALAATLLTTSLTAGYAASPAGHERGRLQSENGEALNMWTGPSGEAPPAPATRAKFAPDHVMPYQPRLSKITAELGAATRLINADRHHGYLTAMEANKLRSEDRSIRMTAFASADKNGGRLPEAQFVALQKQVADLNGNIHRYVNSAHA